MVRKTIMVDKDKFRLWDLDPFKGCANSSINNGGGYNGFRWLEAEERVIPKESLLAALAGLREKVDVPNPYPVDVFPEIDEKTWSNIDFLLRKYLGFPLDRVSGNIGRRLFEGWKKKTLEDIDYYFQLHH